MERPTKLFATDLDGTLLIPGDTIHPNDVTAIREAREQGVVFTLATGRLTSRTHHIARALELDAPLVCADGGIVACSKTERVLERHAVGRELSVAVLELFQRESLASFVFTSAEIHACHRGREHHAFVQGWAYDVTVHHDLRAGAFEQNDDAIMLVGIGEEESVGGVVERLGPFRELVDVFRFEFAGTKVVRLLAKGTSKGAALARLAEELGIARQDTAVVGDWLNDLSMFEYAGRSFAMPHAPEQLKRGASDLLDEEDAARGPIATALQRWLSHT